MNTYVIYDSQIENTAQIAQIIADTLRTRGEAQAIRVDAAATFDMQDKEQSYEHS